MALYIAEQEANRWIRLKVYEFWNGLSPDEWDEVTRSYLKKYGHLLPSDMIEEGGTRMYLNMADVLILHPKLLYGLKKVNR